MCATRDAQFSHEYISRILRVSVFHFQSTATQQAVTAAETVTAAAKANLAQRQAAAAAFCTQYQRIIANERGGQARDPKETPARNEYVFGMDPLERARPNISAEPGPISPTCLQPLHQPTQQNTASPRPWLSPPPGPLSHQCPRILPAKEPSRARPLLSPPL